MTQLENAKKFAQQQTDEDGKTRLIVIRSGAVAIIFPHQIEPGDDEQIRIEKRQ